MEEQWARTEVAWKMYILGLIGVDKEASQDRDLEQLMLETRRAVVGTLARSWENLELSLQILAPKLQYLLNPSSKECRSLLPFKQQVTLGFWLFRGIQYWPNSWGERYD